MKSLISFTLISTVLVPVALAVPTEFRAIKEPEIKSLSRRQRGATNENDLTNGNACADMTIIFARGTTEAGNVGTLTGPPFFDAVREQMGAASLNVQGVEYPANVAGFAAGGDAEGSQLMAQLVQQTIQDCPQSAVVMSGYSQGGQLVHNAADMLSAADSQAVSSAVIFGDPNNGDAVGNIPASNTMVICNTGDLICAGQAIILAPHLTYSRDADQAAAFVVQQAGL